MSSVRLAILSDLHFFLKEDGNTSAASHLPIDSDGDIWGPKRGPKKNPWDDLTTLIQNEGLTADAIVCPGDITTAANQTALKTAWKSLNDLAIAMKAECLYVATGNHDVDSRSQKNRIDKNPIRELSSTMAPVEALKTLEPPYPYVRLTTGLEEERRNAQSRYFGESFVIADHDPRYRVLIFNSCSEHGHDPFEYERGTTPASSLRWIEKDLAKLSDQKINILVAHHPLIPQSSADGDSYSFQSRGDALIKVLGGHGDAWLILNGHKHNGEVRNAPTGSGTPMTMFSSASFAAASDVVEGGYDNQFYIIDVELAGDGTLHGKIRAWNWNVGHEWRLAPPGSNGGGIFDGCGFGSKLSAKQIADKISDLVIAGTDEWSKIRDQLEELMFVMPDALRAAFRILEKNHGLKMEYGPEGFFTRVVKKA